MQIEAIQRTPPYFSEATVTTPTNGEILQSVYANLIASCAERGGCSPAP